MITGIAHAAFGSNDMEKTLDFYCNKLGFKHAFSLQDDKGNPWIEYVKVCDGQFIEFFYMDEPDAHDKVFKHICLEVDDAHKTFAELSAKGVVMTSAINVGKDGNTQFWSKDPDGTPIEFMQISPDSKQANS